VFDQDVFVSVVGGARVDEPAVDLALAIAITSSLRDRPLAHELIAFGEVGLTGEVRGVPRAAARLTEARKLGFTHAILPQSSIERLEPSERKGIELIGVRSLHDALAAALQR
jgi:DNA repair protein RadA/Sms